MLRCIAVDDEQLALDLLEDNISKVPYLQLAAKCSNALEAMKILQTEPIDLIFLDIQMPGLTGLQFIQSMTKKPMIILITAYEKYALQGFNLDVVDYLLKPVPLDRFVRACNKAWELYQLRNAPQSLKPADKVPVPDYFFVNMDYALFKVVISDIIWVEGLKDYIKIHLKNTNRPIIPRMSMKVVEQLLPANRFIRIHKSYIVSTDQITAIRKNSVFLGETEIPVSDNYRDAVSALVKKTL